MKLVTLKIEPKDIKRYKDLTPQEKWQIFLETNAKDAPVGEILRRYGLYSSELTRDTAAGRSRGFKRVWDESQLQEGTSGAI